MMMTIVRLLATSALAGLLLPGGATAEDVPTRISLHDNPTAYAVRTTLQTLGFEAVEVTDQRGRVFDAVANWEGQPLILKVDARQGRIISPPGDDAMRQNEMPLSLALFGHTTSRYRVKRSLETIGFDDVDVTEKRGSIFYAAAQWDDDPVDLRVDASLGRIEDMAMRGTPPAAMPTQVGGTDDTTTRYRLADRLRDVGFANVAFAERDGAVFYGTADWNGATQRVRIDASTGRITAL